MKSHLNSRCHWLIALDLIVWECYVEYKREQEESRKQMRTEALPQSPVLSSSTPWNDFGDENAGVFANVRVICATSDTEAQTWIPLNSRWKKRWVWVTVRKNIN